MKNKFDWIILLGIIFLQVGALFVIGRLIVSNNDQLILEKHKLLALEDRDSYLMKLQSDYRLIEKDTVILNQILPGKKEIVDLLGEIESEASLSGVVAKINFADKSVMTESANIKFISFTISLKGNYFKIAEFIKKIEDLPQVIVVSKVSMQSPNGISSDINAILSLKCYIDPRF
ncbi:type 4a pilus biogenesis protein PilO [Patescibacteria group bacterium]